VKQAPIDKYSILYTMPVTKVKGEQQKNVSVVEGIFM